LVLFDAMPGQGGGLYIQGRVQELHADSPEFRHAYLVAKKVKDETAAPMAEAADYLRPGGQRLYQVTPEKLWVNASEKGPNGVIVRDRRYEILITDIT
jgi:hypothetical protein